MNSIRNHPHAIAGYVARFDVVSPHGGRREQIRPGAFAKALLAGGWFLFENHRNYADDGALSLSSMRTGTLHVEEDAVGLWFEAALRDDADGARMMALLHRGQVLGASTGSRFNGGLDHWLTGNGVDILTESNPGEISLMTNAQPARQGTWVLPIAEALPRKGKSW